MSIFDGLPQTEPSRTFLSIPKPSSFSPNERSSIKIMTAGERPNFVFFHGAPQIDPSEEDEHQTRLAKGCPRKTVPDKAFQPAVDEFGV